MNSFSATARTLVYCATSICFCITLSLTGCSQKKEPVPYYAFSEQDQLWLQHVAKTEWRFSNGQREKRFLIDTVEVRYKEEERSGSGGILFGSNKLLNYYDIWQMRIIRTDSVAPAGYITFTKGKAPNAIRPSLFATGYWYSYIGVDSGSGGVTCQLLNFPSAFPGPTQQLTVAGRPYAQVIALEATGFSVPNCYYPYSVRMTTQRIYYDRQAGIVRMIEKNGDVWDRLP